MRVFMKLLDGERVMLERVSMSKVEELKTQAASGGFWTFDDWTVNTKIISEFRIVRDTDRLPSEEVEERDRRISRRRLKEEKGDGPQQLKNDKLLNRVRTPKQRRGKRT